MGSSSIYESQLRTRADAPAHRAAFGLPMIGTVSIAEVMTPPRLVLPSDIEMDEARRLLGLADVTGAPIAPADGRFAGVVTVHPSVASSTVPSAATETAYPTIPQSGTLDIALDALVSAGLPWVPVLDGDELVGIVGMNEVINGYQGALRRSLRLLPGDMPGSALVEAAIGAGSPFAGVLVRNAPWPAGGVAVSIDRGGHLIAPRGGTLLQRDDLVVAVVPRGREDELRRLLEGQGSD